MYIPSKDMFVGPHQKDNVFISWLEPPMPRSASDRAYETSLTSPWTAATSHIHENYWTKCGKPLISYLLTSLRVDSTHSIFRSRPLILVDQTHKGFRTWQKNQITTIPCYFSRLLTAIVYFEGLMRPPSARFCRPYFLSRMEVMPMKPVVSSGLKLSRLSMDASSASYSFSVSELRPST